MGTKQKKKKKNLSIYNVFTGPGDILGIKDSLTEFWSSHQVLVHVFKGPWPQLGTSRSRLHINWTPMCPAQTNLSISHFLQLFRRFFLWGVLLGPGISGKILKMPGHTRSHPEIHTQVSSSRQRGRRECRRGQEDSVCGRGSETESIREGEERDGGKETERGSLGLLLLSRFGRV